ncbi:MAG: AMP-binding protein, partial [Hyphomicrobiales bacterium]|nr:AMP-binding protein [Hyphomicrobiales bacterium]
MTAPIGRDPTRTLPVVVDRLAERFGDAPALLSDNGSLSFQQLAGRSRAYAAWAIEHGIGKGDVVAVILPNSPEYLAVWLGITRIGGIAALINTNLVGDSLLHSLAIASPRGVIVG